MLACDTDIVVSWRSRPRGFVALMGLYESNYLRFLRLAGDPLRLHGTLISRVAGDCELRLVVLDHARYTSTLLLTYRLPLAAGEAPRPEQVPDLRLKAYHDARLLEAEAGPPSAPPPNASTFPGPAVAARRGRPAERELHRRWARNMMLNKWLEYCAERGHRFSIQL